MELVCDLTDSEEVASDGVMSFSINAHNELCAIHKPGGLSANIATVLSATKLASNRTTFLHTLLTQSLNGLEEQVKQQRKLRLEWLRSRNNNNNNPENENTTQSGVQLNKGQNKYLLQQSGGGIDRDDPILDFNVLHKPFVYADQ